MGNLSVHYHSSSSAAASPNPDSPLFDHARDSAHVPDGYLSDDPAAHASCSTNQRGDRKKGFVLFIFNLFIINIYVFVFMNKLLIFILFYFDDFEDVV
jgi:hypothetical protein